MMFIKKIFTSIFIAAAFTTAAVAQTTFTRLYPNMDIPRVSASYDTILWKTWEGIRLRNVDAFPQTGTTARMIHRPKSEMPGDAVSEGISYGMYLALYMNDQEYFNKIWDGGERWMLDEGSGGFYHWRRSSTGGPTGDLNAASDADQDIALLLIFADQLVKNGIWQPFTSMRNVTYAQRAQRLLDEIRTTMVADGRYLRPGNFFGNRDHLNPGYFAPAFYRVFAEFDPANAAAWNALIEGSYEVIANSPGYERGLLPDWCAADGSYTTGQAGYNGYLAGRAQYRDAIRVYWRLAKDYLWYGEPRAKQFLDNAMAFLESLGGPEAANFYDMYGELVPANDVEFLNGRTIPRSRREHSALTVGMWAAAAIGTGNRALAERYSDHLLTFYEGRNYWGHAVDPNGERTITNARDQYGDMHPSVTVAEDTLRNEMYFDQFLAWFGAALLGGITTNVWDDLKDGIPDGTPLSWKTNPNITPATRLIDAREAPMRLTASINRSARWTVELRHEDGAAISFNGQSDTIDIAWYGMSQTGSYMPQGLYYVTVTAGTLTHESRVWLGMPHDDRPNLLTGNRLLVDDFVDGDVYPYIGSVWNTTNRTGGGNATATANITFPTADKLRFNYTLDGSDNWKSSALNWQMGRATDFSGGVVDTIIFTASSQANGLEVGIHLLSADFTGTDDCFFENRITINTAETTFRFPLAESAWTLRENCGGSRERSFSNTLSQITGIRFHIQYEPGENGSGAIILDNMYFAGANIRTLYNVEDPPSEFLNPPDDTWMNVRHRASTRNQQYQIRRSANMVRVSLPQNMAHATASVIDIRGRVVHRANVMADGRLEIGTRNLASGVYFIDIKKQGAGNIRVPLRLTR